MLAYNDVAAPLVHVQLSHDNDLFDSAMAFEIRALLAN